MGGEPKYEAVVRRAFVPTQEYFLMLARERLIDAAVRIVFSQDWLDWLRATNCRHFDTYNGFVADKVDQVRAEYRRLDRERRVDRAVRASWGLIKKRRDGRRVITPRAVEAIEWMFAHG